MSDVSRRTAEDLTSSDDRAVSVVQLFDYEVMAARKGALDTRELGDLAERRTRELSERVEGRKSVENDAETKRADVSRVGSQQT